MGLFTGVTVMTALQHIQQGCVFSILKLEESDKSNRSLVLMGMLLPGADWLLLVFFQSWQVVLRRVWDLEGAWVSSG